MKKIIAITAAISMFAACGAAFAAQNSPSNPTPVPYTVTVSTPKPATGTVAKPTAMPDTTEVVAPTSAPVIEVESSDVSSKVEEVIKDTGSDETYVELSFGDTSGNDVSASYGSDYVVKDSSGKVLTEAEAYNKILNGDVSGLSIDVYNKSIQSVSYDVYDTTAGTVTSITADANGNVVVTTLAPGNHGGGGTNGSDTYKSVASRKATDAPATEATDAPATDATAAPDETTAPTSAPIEIVNPSVTDAPIATVAPTEGGTTEVQGGIAGTTGANASTAADAADTVASLSDGKDYVEYSTYDVWASDDVKDQIASTPGAKVSMTLDAGLYPNDEFIAVVNYGDGWVQVPADSVVVNGDGTVTVLLDSTGVVSFWVPGTEFAEVAYEAPAGGKNAGKHVEPVSVKAASSSNDTPCKDAEYTVEKTKDYTQVSPQTGYAEAWVVEASTPAGL